MKTTTSLTRLTLTNLFDLVQEGILSESTFYYYLSELHKKELV